MLGPSATGDRLILIFVQAQSISLTCFIISVTSVHLGRTPYSNVRIDNTLKPKAAKDIP